MLYRICNLTVEMKPAYCLLQDRARKFLSDEQDKLKNPPDIALCVDEDDIDRFIGERSGFNRELAEYVLYGSEFYNAVLDFDAFFLHSSAVALDGRAYLFTAPCGGGKSTHTALWRKTFPRCVMINDDKPVIRRIDGALYACGTPFSGKNDINANIVVRLQGISIIEKAKNNSIERLPADKAFALLFEQTLRTVTPARAAALMELMDELLKTTGVYLLRCNMLEESARMSYNAMFNG